MITRRSRLLATLLLLAAGLLQAQDALPPLPADATDPTAPAGDVAVGAYAYTFGPYPRLRAFHTALFPADGSPLSDQAKAKLVTTADTILARGLDVPEEQGNWIFYYACREHNTSLRLGKDGLHRCPKCDKTFNDDDKVMGAHITKRHGRLEDDLIALGHAYHLTRDPKYAQPIVDALLTYARHYPSWKRHDRWGRWGMLAVIGGRRYAQSLDEAYGGIRLARAYDLIAGWDGISAADRATIERDCFGEIVETIYRMYAFYEDRNNHMTWFNAGVAAIATVLGRGDWLDRTWAGPKGLNHQLTASVSKDGFWYEGTIAYHFYALQAIIQHTDAMAGAGRDLTTDPRLKPLFTFPVNLAYPSGQFPAYNDGDRASVRNYRGLYAWAARHWDDPAIRAFAETGKLDALPSAVYDASGYVYLRRGEGDSAVTVALDYGEHGGHHGHPDKLQMVAYARGQELFLDPGRLTYRCDEYETWTRQTPAHNTVGIDRQKQTAHTAQLLQFTTTADYAAAVVASDQAYAGVHLRRAVVLYDDAIIDLFLVRCEKPRRIDWFLHGTIPLSVDLPLTERAEPIHDDAGYQHLKNLRQGRIADTPVAASWTVGTDNTMRSWFIAQPGDELVTGTGIGYTLTQRLPFIMLSAQAGTRLFVAIHDLSGGDASVIAAPVLDGNTLRLSHGDQSLTITLDPTAADSPLTVTSAAPTAR